MEHSIIKKMKTILHKSNTRGAAFFGWLDSKHTFSFGRYYHPERMNFGALRVLNDDIVEGGMGFGTHPHDNMEIVSIPLSGALAHKDSTGNEKVIQSGEVQIMSAGTGLSHSEYNHSKTEKVNFLQVWVMPKKLNIKPRYEQKMFDPSGRLNQFQTVVAPDHDDAVWINQDAWFSLAKIETGQTLDYRLRKENSGIYTFVISGQIKMSENTLGKRDGLGIYDTDQVAIESVETAEILVIEVPMI